MRERKLVRRRILSMFLRTVCSLVFLAALNARAINPSCPALNDGVPPPPGGDNGRPCGVSSDGCPCKNSPVYVQLGVPTFSRTDLTAGGPGLPLAIERQYMGSSHFLGMLGFAWMTPFEEHISEETDGTNCVAVFLMKDGRTTHFLESSCGAGTYVNQDGYPWTLVFNVPYAGMWSLFKEDGTSQVFDQWGSLSSVAGPDGDTIQLSYGAQHELVQAVDPRRPSRVLTFSYGANGFLSAVSYSTSSGTRTATYVVDPNTGDLVSSTSPDGWTETYSMQSIPGGGCQGPHLITGVQRSLGSTVFPPLEINAFSVDLRLSQKAESGRAITWSYPPNTVQTVQQTITQEVWTDARGIAHTKKLYVDPMGRITKILHYEGTNLTPISSETRVYDPVTGKVAYSQDASGLWTHTQYDGLGNTISVTRAFCDNSGTYPCTGNPRNQTWTYAYTSINGIPKLTDISGPTGYAHTRMEYYTTTDPSPEGGIAGKLHYLKRVNDDASEDALANYTYVTDGLGAAYGQVKRIVNGTGGVTTYDYDTSGALLTVTLPDNSQTGLTVGYTPDAFYQVSQVTDQAGSVTALFYDAAGRTQQVQPPDPSTGKASSAYATAYGYDIVDTSGTYSPDPLVKSTVTDPNGRVTERYADAEGKVFAVKNAAGGTTRYAYYPGGLLYTITDANGNQTTYAYDGMDRLSSVTDPYGKVTTYAYYADGKLHTRTDAKGQTLTYAYDNLGRLTTKTYGALGTVTFTYNGDRVATVADTYHPQVNGQSQSYTYGYDIRHRLTSVNSPTGTVSYTYISNTSDQIATVSDGAQTWTYAYYLDGSLHTITAPEGVYTYTYNRVGQAAQVEYPSATRLIPTYQYDAQHRLTTVFNSSGSRSSWPSRHDYIYDEVRNGTPLRGMITSVRESFLTPGGEMIGGLKPLTTSYDYDSLYQLTQAVYPASDNYKDIDPVPPWASQSHSWKYDAIGNRQSATRTDNATGAVLDVAAYTYNLNGLGPQLAGVTHTDGSPAASFTYDENGNTETQVAGNLTITYNWDMDDKMAGYLGSYTGEHGDYTYAYNGDRLQNSQSNSLMATSWTYLYSREDILKVVPIYMGPRYYTQGPGVDDVLAETAGGDTQYAFKNLLSSVVGFTDASGAVSKSNLYDAWGQPVAWGPGPLSWQYSYTGRERDAEQMYYYRNRFYRPDIGRFLSVDPSNEIQDYSYVDNSPLDSIDPSGLQAAPPSGPGGGASGGCCQPSQWSYQSPALNRLSPQLSAMMDCLQKCFCQPSLVVTSTSNLNKQHGRMNPHCWEAAVDIGYPSNPSKLLCCARQCGFNFALDEKVHPSGGSTGAHIHLSTAGCVGVRGGTPNFLPQGPATPCK